MGKESSLKRGWRGKQAQAPEGLRRSWREFGFYSERK